MSEHDPTGDVEPGGSVVVELEVHLPREGPQGLKLDLVDERVCWFEDAGSQAVVM